jgi:methyl-accepting chemotaxis protein
MSTADLHKRKVLNLAVNRTMQLRMIGRIGMILFVSLVVSSTIYFFFANREITASFQMFHIHARNFLDFLLPVVIVSFVLSLAIGGVATLFFPGSIAGGLYGIERDIRRVADGDLTVRIKLRKGDAVHGLATEINRMLDGLQGRLQAIHDGLEEAHAACSPDTAAGNTPQELRAIVTRTQDALRELRLS